MNLNPASIAMFFIAFHMIGDYVTQTSWMAANKFVRSHVGLEWKDGTGIACTRGDMIWHAAMARTIHVLLYSLPFLALGCAVGGATLGALLCAAIFIPHWIIDCRRWASPESWPPKPIMVDQALHAMHLAIVFAVFFGK